VAVEDALLSLGAEVDGSIAVDNARLAYVRFKELFSGERWERLERSGARPQRLLWASTGTKNDALPDTFYVDELIGGPTVNTVPPATLDAFVDHGTVAATLERDVAGAWDRFDRLSRIGIDLEKLTNELQAAGVNSFANSFASLLEGVDQKRRRPAG
jgi:transaldolase